MTAPQISTLKRLQRILLSSSFFLLPDWLQVIALHSPKLGIFCHLIILLSLHFNIGYNANSISGMEAKIECQIFVLVFHGKCPSPKPKGGICLTHSAQNYSKVTSCLHPIIKAAHNSHSTYPAEPSSEGKSWILQLIWPYG